MGATSVEAAARGAVLHAFLDQVLLPGPRRAKPDAVLVTGDLAAHETRAVRELLDGSGSGYRHLPPHSPDPDPVEPAWSKVEGLPRKSAARTVDVLHAAPGPALAAVSAQDAAGFFGRVGHARPG